MKWNLFIDDERYFNDVFWAPAAVKQQYTTGLWYVARNKEQALYTINTLGNLPSFISFDHDLGATMHTGFDIASAIVELCLDGEYELPDDFDYYVHSQNPVGKANIEGYLKGYLKAHKRAGEAPFNKKPLPY